MEHQLITGVWEITMACNMRCGHCGSRCAERLPNELTTDEALKLCDDIAELGANKMSKFTLSGGEPFTRPDWDRLAARLRAGGVPVNIISNGWLIDDRIIDRALEAGLVNIAVSVDGLKSTHDSIRREGSFDRTMRALDLMKKRQFPAAAVTTVMRRNLPELAQMHQVLQDHGVECWQLQVGLPMGNLKPADVIAPAQLDQVIDFLHGLLGRGSVKPFIADSIGYYTPKVMQLLESINSPGCAWMGCDAGKRNIGILHDGSILGCTSIRDAQFVEGNFRQTPLREIWTRERAFAWNRNFTKGNLTGFCRTCPAGALCRGGCSNLKLTMTGGLTENPYCAYRVSIERLFPKIEQILSVETLLARASHAQKLGLWQLADKCLTRALVLEPDNIAALKALGYVCYKLEDFERCVEINQHAARVCPEDAYVQKGLGVSLARVGQINAAIAVLTKAIELDADFPDAYHDLAVVLLENNRPRAALNVLDQGRQRSVPFRVASEKLYQSCRARLDAVEGGEAMA